MEYLLPGFVLGILGSLHCLGMCGPLALAVPHTSRNKLRIALDSLIYNTGRILTYTILGFALGAIGSSIKFASYQEFISIAMGLGLLIVYFFPKKMKLSIGKLKIIESFNSRLKKGFQKFMAIQSMSSLFVIGLLNGLLPCGLVYVALTGAVANGEIIEGGLYMLLFGAGTLPMMFTVFFAKGFITPSVRIKVSRIIPVGVALIGILLVLRGMSLGIPYISPHLGAIGGLSGCCH